MLKLKKSHTVAIVLLSLALGAIASVALARTHRRHPTPHAGPPTLAPTAAVDPRIARELLVFRNARQAATDIPPASVEQQGWYVEKQFGANRLLARRATSGRAMYLIPAQAGVCLLNTDGPENFCATPREVQEGEAVETTLCAPGTIPADEIQIGGILPDTATNARVRLTGGGSVPLVVTGDVFTADFARTGALPTAIEFDEANGQRAVAAVVMPEGVATERCDEAP